MDVEKLKYSDKSLNRLKGNISSSILNKNILSNSNFYDNLKILQVNLYNLFKIS
jgi:hypothetical protein